MSLLVGFLSSSPMGQKVSEYDQDIPQSHTADQPTVPRERATEHLYVRPSTLIHWA